MLVGIFFLTCFISDCEDVDELRGCVDGAAVDAVDDDDDYKNGTILLTL